MKNLKKFAALLLAGAMALLMLTACGGGSDFGKRDPDAEDEAFGRFTTLAPASALKENDRSMQAVAEKHLREDLNSSIEVLGAKLVGKVHVEGKEKEYLTITVTGRYDYGFIVSAILNDIQSAIGKELPGTKVDVKGNGSWTKIGVVVRTDGTHSYVAVAFQVRNPNYKLSPGVWLQSCPPGLFLCLLAGEGLRPLSCKESFL